MEATKERVARCNRATPARTSGSSPAHGSRTQSIARRRRRAKARIRQASVLMAAAAIVAGIVMVVLLYAIPIALGLFALYWIIRKAVCAGIRDARRDGTE